MSYAGWLRLMEPIVELVRRIEVPISSRFYRLFTGWNLLLHRISSLDSDHAGLTHDQNNDPRDCNQNKMATSSSRHRWPGKEQRQWVLCDHPYLSRVKPLKFSGYLILNLNFLRQTCRPSEAILITTILLAVARWHYHSIHERTSRLAKQCEITGRIS